MTERHTVASESTLPSNNDNFMTRFGHKLPKDRFFIEVEKQPGFKRNKIRNSRKRAFVKKLGKLPEGS
jgi:hypothetical protein